MIAAASDSIRARDQELGVALDVTPPAVDAAWSPSHEYVPAGSAKQHGIAYRAARKVYRKLKTTKFLQPLLERIRQEILIRS